MTNTTTRAKNLLDLNFVELRETLVADGIGPGHTKPLWQFLHRSQPRTELPTPLQSWLNEHLDQDILVEKPGIASDIESNDGQTRKLLLRLDDGHEIETVIMGYPGRYTVCLSTQVGCAMGCVFCATGQMGFVRHLRPGEIVAQALTAQHLLLENGDNGIRNIVMMGMGEPLHNYDAVIKALGILSDRRGMGIAQSRITICTVGLVPEINRLAEEKQPYNLALSLHAATDEERTALVPVNHRWPLAGLLEACRNYSKMTGRKIFFGWTLIAEQNDTPENARQVASLLRGMDAHLNLIPLNITAGFDGQTSEANAAAVFSKIVQESGTPCTIRQRRGIDVAAGCGQLKSSVANKRKPVQDLSPVDAEEY